MLIAIGYFRNSFLVTVAGLGLGAFLGWEATASLTGALSTMFIVAVLAILEVSLSFEHGAFYAIIALAVIMFLNTVRHIPEVVTGLIGAGFIVTAFVDSVRYNRGV
jgi:uncharacterized protein